MDNNAQEGKILFNFGFSIALSSQLLSQTFYQLTFQKDMFHDE
jgi:hypothetical protein